MSAGLYDDDGKIVQRGRQQQSPLNRFDDDAAEDTSGMFQADYQYTPLKDYAAVRSRATSNDPVSNGYRSNDSKFDANIPTYRHWQVERCGFQSSISLSLSAFRVLQPTTRKDPFAMSFFKCLQRERTREIRELDSRRCI